jgi:hypothetical protein
MKQALFSPFGLQKTDCSDCLLCQTPKVRPVYLTRRVSNLSLQEVAGRFGVSAARISQIQTKMEQGQTSPRMAPC